MGEASDRDAQIAANTRTILSGDESRWLAAMPSWPYVSGILIEEKFERLQAEAYALRQDLKDALDLLSRTEDVEWDSAMRNFLLAHGYTERMRDGSDMRALVPSEREC